MSRASESVFVSTIRSIVSSIVATPQPAAGTMSWHDMRRFREVRGGDLGQQPGFQGAQPPGTRHHDHVVRRIAALRLDFGKSGPAKSRRHSRRLSWWPPENGLPTRSLKTSIRAAENE